VRFHRGRAGGLLPATRTEHSRSSVCQGHEVKVYEYTSLYGDRRPGGPGGLLPRAHPSSLKPPVVPRRGGGTGEASGWVVPCWTGVWSSFAQVKSADGRRSAWQERDMAASRVHTYRPAARPAMGDGGAAWMIQQLPPGGGGRGMAATTRSTSEGGVTSAHAGDLLHFARLVLPDTDEQQSGTSAQAPETADQNHRHHRPYVHQQHSAGNGPAAIDSRSIPPAKRPRHTHVNTWPVQLLTRPSPALYLPRGTPAAIGGSARQKQQQQQQQQAFNARFILSSAPPPSQGAPHGHRGVRAFPAAHDQHVDSKLATSTTPTMSPTMAPTSTTMQRAHLSAIHSVNQANPAASGGAAGTKAAQAATRTAAAPSANVPPCPFCNGEGFDYRKACPAAGDPPNRSGSVAAAAAAAAAGTSKRRVRRTVVRSAVQSLPPPYCLAWPR
jgi:hypothetical protein